MSKLVSRTLLIIAILLILTVGTILRIHNITPYLLYSDSYQSLIATMNLHDYGSIYATLGKGGMFYPPYFGWTRPLLPLLLNALSHIVDLDLVTIAHVTLIVLSVASIILSYVVFTSLFRNRFSGLLAAIVLAISYNHAVWSGFVLTEALGVFVILLTMLSVITALRRNKDILWATAGILSGVSITARYEYAVLLIPLALLLIHNRITLKRFFIIAISSAATFTLLFTIVGGFSFPVASIGRQIGRPLLVLILTICGLILAFVACKTLRLANIDFTRYRSRVIFLLVLGFLTTFIILRPIGFIHFIVHDFTLSFLALLGAIALLKSRHYRLFFFTLATIISLGSIYYLSNSTMERYITHLIPFFLIYVAYLPVGLAEINISKKIISVVLLMAILIGQIATSFTGLRVVDSVWFTKGYEDIVAERVAVLSNNSDVIIAAMPEPYRLYSSASVTSLSTQAPYLPFYKYDDDQIIILINDAGMKEYFPNAYIQFQHIPNRYKVESFHISEPLRTRTLVEKNPVNADVYMLSKKQLVESILQ